MDVPGKVGGVALTALLGAVAGSAFPDSAGRRLSTAAAWAPAETTSAFALWGFCNYFQLYPLPLATRLFHLNSWTATPWEYACDSCIIEGVKQHHAFRRARLIKFLVAWKTDDESNDSYLINYEKLSYFMQNINVYPNKNETIARFIVYKAVIASLVK